MAAERRDRSRAVWVALAVLAAVAQAFITIESRRRERDARAQTAAAAGATQGATYYVGGHVARPGAYTVSTATTTLRQAMDQAGAAGDAAGGYALIVRRSGADSELIKVELGPLLRDAAGDEPLLPGDQVLVSEGR